MPYAENEGTRIYFETDGPEAAPPIVMHHGFTTDLETWRRRGYVDRLRDRFRLILMDARGHGQSDKPHEVEAYDVRTRVMDVVSVLNANNVRQAHYVGYSMGGMVGLSMLVYAPQRLLSLNVGGASPMYDPRRAESRSAEQFDEYLRGAMSRNPILRESVEAGRTDVEALRVCRDAGAGWGGAEQAVRLAEVPVLLYAGTDDAPHDGCQRAVALNPRVRFLSLAGKNHRTAAEASELVVPAILENIAAAVPAG